MVLHITGHTALHCAALSFIQVATALVVVQMHQRPQYKIVVLVHAYFWTSTHVLPVSKGARKED